MGAFDQFEDQAESAGKANGPVGNKRNKPADTDNRGQMKRGTRRDGQERRPKSEEEMMRDRTNSTNSMSDEMDEWA
jgi:hypothetical protein